MYEADYSGTRWLASFAVDMLTAPCRILERVTATRLQEEA